MNCRWPVAPAGDVLDHGVREAEVELAVRERKLAPVGAHRGHGREGGGEAVELGVADAGDALGPRVERLEEVVARAVPERRVGHADVDHGRLGAGLEEIEEEAQLPFPAPQRDASRSAMHHRKESNGAGGAGSGPPAPSRGPTGPSGSCRSRRPWQRRRPLRARAVRAARGTTSRAPPSRFWTPPPGRRHENSFVVNPVIRRHGPVDEVSKGQA